MLTTNMIIDNRYKILDEIGRGGMSIVYRATVERSGKIWAVKEVRKDGRNDYNVVKQNLIAEIETLKEVKHPKLPEIADVIDNDDSFIIVMDYIEGVSLDKILSKKGVQSEEKVVNWGKQLCEVLGYLHSKNIIYRDMKPSNVMLKKNGEITIIDFGTAKKYEYDSGETTGLGTAGFAAPEQYGGHGRTDARTDIFCLGMTMYALLTGHDPQREFIPDTSILKENPAFSAGLDYIIKKCTNKNPAERYQSCEELLYDLNQYKEIDRSSRKKKMLKVGAFISCFLLSIVSAVLGYVSQVQIKNLASDDYTDFIQQAQEIKLNSNSENIEKNYNKKIELYKNAIAISEKSDRKDANLAYIGLLETYLGNDNVIDDNEHTEFNDLYLANEERLKENPQNYLDLCYKAWEMIYSNYNNEDAIERLITADDWLKKMYSYIEENEKNEEVIKYKGNKDYKIASNYHNVYELYNKIEKSKGNEFEDITGTYTEILNVLNKIYDETDEKNQTVKTQINFLETILKILYQYAFEFKNDNVPYEEINELYEKVSNKFLDMKGKGIINANNISSENIKKFEDLLSYTKENIDVVYKDGKQIIQEGE